MSTNDAGLARLVLVDEKDMRQVLPVPPGQYREPCLSPNGKQAAWVAFDESQKSTIWIYDLGGNTAPRRLTFDNSDYPLWTPDSKRIIFASRETTAGGVGGLMWQNADRTGTAEVLASRRETTRTVVLLQNPPMETFWLYTDEATARTSGNCRSKVTTRRNR